MKTERPQKRLCLMVGAGANASDGPALGDAQRWTDNREP
jgi:hypothetical protein